MYVHAFLLLYRVYRVKLLAIWLVKKGLLIFVKTPCMHALCFEHLYMWSILNPQ